MRYPNGVRPIRAGRIGLAAVVTILLATSSALAIARDTPLVVELFTSESCSSCPPADAWLGEVRNEEGVIALSYHVDYWNRLGWVDQQSTPEFTQRQRDYAARLGVGVFTPQLIADGRYSAVASRKRETRAAMKRAEREDAMVPVRLQSAADGLLLTVDEAPDVLRGSSAGLWLMSFEPEVATDIGRGENRGRRIRYYNVVRSIRHLGEWRGEPLSQPVRLQPDETGRGLAVLLQTDTGAVLGAGLAAGLGP